MALLCQIVDPITALTRPADGPPQGALVLLHGWPEWSHVWRPVMSRLADEFDLVAPDFRGFGDSQKTSLTPARDATPEALATDILALADVLGLERIGLVAHDIGAFVAQVMARRSPGRIAGLFFFNCAYPGIGARWVEPGHLLETWYQFFHQMPWVADLIGSSRSQRTFNFGARPQRLLMASTGTKDPKASDILYIRGLAAPLTVNTMPEATLKAFADHGEIGATLSADGGDSEAVLAQFAKAGVDVDALAARLQKEGAESFVKSWNELMSVIASKSAALEKAS
jgi:pimeloyl-ACP methyl ester carboxylesterase